MPSIIRKNKERLKLLEKTSKNCKSITNMFEKACDKFPVLQDSSVVNTTTSAQVIDQNNADNSTTSTGQNQQQRKDTEEGAMEKISINIFTKSQPTNFEFPKTEICKKNRSFNSHWYSKFPWIHYSIEKDVVLCLSYLSAGKKGTIQCAIEKILLLFQGDSEIGKRLVNGF